MSCERELKLQADATALQRIRDWLHSQSAKAHPARLTESLYFDSPDCRLQKSGISLRIRSDAEHSVQTIKSAERRTAGLFERAEWETGVQGFLPDFAAAISTGLKPFHEHELRASLRPVFSVETHRATFDLPGNSGLKVVLDSGHVIAGELRDEFCEIEIEIGDGNLDQLFTAARQLFRIAPLQLGVETKSGRGYRLLQRPEGIVRAGRLVFSPGISAQDGFRIIARDCLYQFAANLPQTIKGDAEALHQTRVGLRRLRACMSLFSDLIDGRDTTRIKQGLRWVGQLLGCARDIDVLLEEDIHPELRHPLEVERQRGHEGVVSALRSARFSRLTLDTLAWLECGAWTKAKTTSAAVLREKPVGEHAAEELDRRYAKLVKSSRNLAGLSEDERHRVRIRAKKLRYGVEFFAAMFKGDKNARRSHALLSTLKELQTSLGELHDLSVRPQLLLQICAGHSLSPIDAGLALENERRVELLRHAIRVAEEISGTKRFWG
jgi:inorganic triphosphatase YgiF